MQTEINAQTVSRNFFFPPDSIAELAPGDHLNWAEFERRWDAMPKLKKAELIGGIVFMLSPVSNVHAEPHANLLTWLGTYRAFTPGTRVSDNATLRYDDENAPQPDAALWIDEKFGGTAFVEDKYLRGAPELVAEIAVSSVSYDLHEKKQAYELIGVKEYVVWRVLDNSIDWFVLEKGQYSLLEQDQNSVFESRVFPGLRLAVRALLSNDLAKVLTDLQTGLNSPEHTEFIKNLAQVSLG